MLSNKWKKEQNYRLRKELFAFTDNKVSRTESVAEFLTLCKPVTFRVFVFVFSVFFLSLVFSCGSRISNSVKLTLYRLQSSSGMNTSIGRPNNGGVAMDLKTGHSITMERCVSVR